MGNVTKATEYFKQVEVLSDSSNDVMACKIHVNK